MTSQEELIKKILLLEKKPRARSSLGKYRKLIVTMLLKEFSKKEIFEYLNANNCKVKYTTLTQYLQRNPLTDIEAEPVMKEINEIEQKAEKKRLEQLLNEEI